MVDKKKIIFLIKFYLISEYENEKEYSNTLHWWKFVLHLNHLFPLLNFLLKMYFQSKFLSRELFINYPVFEQ